MTVPKQMGEARAIRLGIQADLQIWPIRKPVAVVVESSAGQNGVDGFAASFSVGHAFKNKHDRGIARDLSLLVDERFSRCNVNRGATKIDRADQRGIDLVATQRTSRDLECFNPASLLGTYRETRACEVVLAVESIGNNIRHRAENTCCGERRAARVAGFGCPFFGLTPLLGHRRQPPPDTETGRLGVGTHADVDPGRRPI